jgi:hypothetical protein
VISRARPPPRRTLFDSYLAERAGDPIDPPIAEHLADCAACCRGYAELAAFMDTLRKDGEVEADAIFTPERLASSSSRLRAASRMSGGRPASSAFPAASSGAPSRVDLALGAPLGRRRGRRRLFVGVAARRIVPVADWQLAGRQACSPTRAAHRPRAAPVATRGTVRPTSPPTTRSCRTSRSRSSGRTPASCRRSTRSRRTCGRFAISVNRVQRSRFMDARLARTIEPNPEPGTLKPEPNA